jgi:hypothetical protein
MLVCHVPLLITCGACQDDILYFEKLFMPAGSYELLPDDNAGAASLSDGDSVTTKK